MAAAAMAGEDAATASSLSAVWAECFVPAVRSSAVEELFMGKESSDELSEEEDKSTAGNSLVEQEISDAFTQLESAQRACHTALSLVDSVLEGVDLVNVAYDDVSGRTNSIVSSCEELLERQNTLQQTADALTAAIEPFTEIESLAQILGIGLDGSATGSLSPSSPSVRSPTNSNGEKSVVSTSLQMEKRVLDPRSVEFQDLLRRLRKSMCFLQTHEELFEAQRYMKWLETLQKRALSLIGRAMRELIDKATTICREIIRHKSFARLDERRLLVEDSPLESAFVYQKFRGLSFRMRELVAILLSGSIDSESSQNDSTGRLGIVEGSMEATMLGEVKAQYISVRTELLRPVLVEVITGHIDKVTVSNPAPTAANPDTTALVAANTEIARLNAALRQAYGTLLRLTQLEVQLFDSLFNVDGSVGAAGQLGTMTTSSTTAVNGISSNAARTRATVEIQKEALPIVEELSSCTRDVLRPLLIREQSVNELCRVISTLRDDVASQISALPLAPSLITALSKGLEAIIADAKERLAYCAETRLRHHVALFEPRPSQLAYPAILEEHSSAAQTTNSPTLPNSSSSASLTGTVATLGTSTNLETLYGTWYPPLRETLLLLSKLFGVVSQPVFEHFARRALEQCTSAIVRASVEVRRVHQPLHGDLFLVRHLLTLREQLAPFELRLQSREHRLDFSVTTAALAAFKTALTMSTRQVLRFDAHNPLYQFAQDGMPLLSEHHTDARRELDMALKRAGLSLKQTVVSSVAGSLDALHAKIAAVAGEIAVPPNWETVTLAAIRPASVPVIPLAETQSTVLRSQPFLRADRIREAIEQTRTLLPLRLPEIKKYMNLYLDNPAARGILMRSVTSEVTLLKMRLDAVISSCLPADNARVDVERQLHATVHTIIAELS